jgi:hypothetical protein
MLTGLHPLMVGSFTVATSKDPPIQNCKRSCYDDGVARKPRCIRKGILDKWEALEKGNVVAFQFLQLADISYQYQADAQYE